MHENIIICPYSMCTRLKIVKYTPIQLKKFNILTKKFDKATLLNYR